TAGSRQGDPPLLHRSASPWLVSWPPRSPGTPACRGGRTARRSACRTSTPAPRPTDPSPARTAGPPCAVASPPRIRCRRTPAGRCRPTPARTAIRCRTDARSSVFAASRQRPLHPAPDRVDEIGPQPRRRDDGLHRTHLAGPLDTVRPVELVGELSQLVGVHGRP